MPGTEVLLQLWGSWSGAVSASEERSSDEVRTRELVLQLLTEALVLLWL